MKSTLKPMLNFALGLAAITASSANLSPSFAASYEAICGSMECRIILSDTQIVTPYGVIPVSRVANWGGSGSSSTDLIMGAAATYLLGPAGLVGFLAKNHDYNYAITGYDREGNRLSLQIRFLNSRPAKEFAHEMLTITGLGMGQTRTASQIRNLEKRMNAEGVESIRALRSYTLEEDLKQEVGQIDRTDKPKSAERNNQCWSDYLDRNPGIKKWATANPKAAAKVKADYKDC